MWKLKASIKKIKFAATTFTKLDSSFIYFHRGLRNVSNSVWVIYEDNRKAKDSESRMIEWPELRPILFYLSWCFLALFLEAK